MITRRNFLGTLGGATALAACPNLWAAGGPAWTKPVGLELFTVRDLFAKDPAGTLKQVAAMGYKEVEFGPGLKPEVLTQYLRAAGLVAPSGYFDSPNTLEDWKKTIEQAHALGLHYIVVGDNPRIDLDAWKRRADLYSQCGKLAQDAGMQFCYHAHFAEFAPVDHTCGYDIMLTRCDAKLLKMEMDVFWAAYAGIDPVPYFQRYPGRFPMLHIKDLRKGYKGSLTEDPPKQGPSPFVPAGQGSINWQRIFVHAGQAGARHIFVEQDRCDLTPLESIKISFNYIKNLRLA